MFRFRVLAFILVFSLCFSFPCWAVNYSDLYDSAGYAKHVDTYSLFPVASASNAPVTTGLGDYINPASSVGNVRNSIDFAGARLFVAFNGMWTFVRDISMAGTFSYVVPAGKTVDGIALVLNPIASLPAAGKYDFAVDFSSDSSLSYKTDVPADIYMYQKNSNATGSGKKFNVPRNVFVSSSGDAYFHFSIDLLSQLKNFDIRYYLSEPVPAGGAIGGKFSVEFLQLGSSSATTTTSPGMAPSSANVQSSIANNTSQIAYSVNQVYDSILALTQHISDQLAAFWDQLYNYIHVPTYNKLQEILKAIQAIQVKVNVDVSSVVDAVDTSADRITSTVNSAINNQISNDNKNTDDLKNGYDNSGMLSDNDRLNDKISQYDDVENQLFDDAKDKIGNFTFDNPLSKYTSVLSDISYFLAGIYEGLGALNIPIGFSLTLTIALIFIGYYRFKGGV